ncbi:MAG TPA: AI-2E family transporter [Nocardioides sp.]|uniref:AI-2E family transporter n=1 Tax=Nocardioides sp. TaxID=35761 RepID=UPI002D7EAEF5|nr:AI-2E family transporter [Nocardioides sp.]HET6651477.1 AI-2E family transporter [Nocardioides sp.]
MAEGNRTTGRLGRSLGRLRATQRAKSEERFAERFAHQWSQIRGDRVHQEEPPPVIDAGPSNLSRAQVPWALDLVAAWSWRFLVIAAAGYVVFYVIAMFSVIFLPLAIALLIAALGSPVVKSAAKVGINRKFSSALVVVGGLGALVLLLTFVGTQVSRGFSDLSAQVVDGLEEIRTWLRTGPLQASDSQINDYIREAQNAITSSSEELLAQVTEVGTAIGHIVAGFFIVLFASYFFLADGARIWAWCVRLFPRAARLRADESGKVAWRSVTQFVRATVIIALADAIGIMIVAAILNVPFVTAIGVLVFLGAFIPMVGATISGSVAVLVALVSHGPVVALLMLGGVILVQQIEAHVLQPFLTGRFVAVHPLAVIVAIGMGVLIGGVAGALLAVPIAAAVNAVGQYLAGYTAVGEEPEEAGTPDSESSPGTAGA